MNMNQFVELVAKMREAQKAFFMSRDTAPLREALKLDNQVDQALRRWQQAREKGDER